MRFFPPSISVYILRSINPLGYISVPYNTNSSVKLLQRRRSVPNVSRVFARVYTYNMCISIQHKPNTAARNNTIRLDNYCSSVYNSCYTAYTYYINIFARVHSSAQNLSRSEQYILTDPRRKRPDYLVQRHLFVYTRV